MLTHNQRQGVLVMSEQVQSYLPNVPERCIGCPALRAAAAKLESHYEVAAVIADMGLQAGNFNANYADTNTAAGELASEIINTATSGAQAFIAETAETYYSACRGPIIRDSEELVQVEGRQVSGILDKFIGRITGRQITVETMAEHRYTACGSTTDAALFSPSESTTYVPYRSTAMIKRLKAEK